MLENGLHLIWSVHHKQVNHTYAQNVVLLCTLHTKTAVIITRPKTGGRSEAAARGSSFGCEKALRGAAFLDGDGQEVAGHVCHQDFFHAAETRPPRHLIQVQVQWAGGRLVQQVRLVQHGQFSGPARVGVGLLLQEWRGRVAAAVVRPASLCVPSVCEQAPVGVEAPVGTAAGHCAAG